MSNKPVVIYPNSGETYDAEHKQWIVSFYLNNDFKIIELVYHNVDEVSNFIYFFSRVTTNKIKNNFIRHQHIIVYFNYLVTTQS